MSRAAAGAARRLYAAELRRRRLLPSVSKDEWAVLVALYVAELGGRMLTVTSAARASGRPETSGLRVLGRLYARDLAGRQAGRSPDRRLVFVGLTEDGHARTEGCLEALAADLALGEAAHG